MEINKALLVTQPQGERRLSRSGVQTKDTGSLPQETVLLSGASTKHISGPTAPVEQAPSQAKIAQSSSTTGPAENAPGVIAMLETPTTRPPKDAKFLAKYGPWGVITGASQGIGAEMARSLAERGLNVVLVARSGDKLEALAQQLRQETGVQVKVVAADLAHSEGLEKVKATTADLEVGLLINNAGAWQFGSFLGNDIERDRQILSLNVEAPMVLAHHFAGKMAERGRGGVINVGSGAALHGVPGQATYSATKGFLRNLTEALHQELKPKGVDVLITNPGPVEGEASSAYDQSKVPLPKVSPRTVAEDAIKNLGGRSSHTTPGRLNKLMNAAVRMMPRDLLSSVAGYVLERATPATEPVTEVARTESQPPVTGTSSKALGATAEASAKNAAGGILGHLWGAVTALTRPVKSLFSTVKFALGFVGDMRTRAQEITKDPGKVEDQLKASGLHHEYSPPQNSANLKLEGKMVIKANMAEFFELWDSWIQKGYGSINDRQYADLVLKFRDQARELPLLAHIPMTSEDVFSAEVKNGLVTSMKETTTTRLGGLIPTSTVHWQYQRTGEPRASNSFEKTVDTFNGDLEKVQAFYQDLFDPRHVNPDSNARVEFIVRQVDDIEQPEATGKEFVHSVKIPAGGLLPQPESTLGGPRQPNRP